MNLSKYLRIKELNPVTELEKRIAEYFGSPYAVATDCCTHGIELCLRFFKARSIKVPFRTYISIPFLAEKLDIKLEWKEEEWQDYYYLTDKIIDAAVLWKKNSYIPGTFMSLSFQFQKHLSLGRGGMILTDDEEIAEKLKLMSYDGRHPDVPWREQNISTMGYHYYMTPETARLGLAKFEQAKDNKPKQWILKDWPDLREMNIFDK
jgi:dTDP-4-amino-4,6-dideoxygalactose transaminase